MPPPRSSAVLPRLLTRMVALSIRLPRRIMPGALKIILPRARPTNRPVFNSESAPSVFKISPFLLTSAPAPPAAVSPAFSSPLTVPDYIDFPTSSSLQPNTTYQSKSFSLVGFPNVRNNPNFGIRIVTEFESTASNGATNNANYVGNTSGYATGGTLSYDLVTINADAITGANTPPDVSPIADRTILDDSPSTINFTVSDAETSAGALNVTATSLSQNILSDSQIAPGGSGASRTLTITPTPGVDGNATIKVTVTDADGDSTVTWFNVTVNPGNLAPTISQVAHTNGLANTTVTIPVTVGDDQTAAGNLNLSGTSANQSLVPNSGITFGGSGANRTVNVTPATDAIGVAPITVVVTDGGGKTASTSFTVMFRPATNVVFNDLFDYPDGSITAQSFGLWQNHSGTAGQVNVTGGVLNLTDAESEDVNAPLIGQPYMTNSGTTLYSSFKVNFSALPSLAGTYFAHFKDTNTGAATGFGARVFASMTNAADSTFRLGIGNGAGATNTSGQFPQDLVLNSNYTVVTRFVLGTGQATIWLIPATNPARASLPLMSPAIPA